MTPRVSRPTRVMLDDLRCTLHLDAGLTDDALVDLVAELTSGTRGLRSVHTAWGTVHIGDDGGDFELRQRDPDDFLGRDLYVDVTPAPDAVRGDVLAQIAALSTALIARGLRVVAIGDDAEDIPGYLP
jgi:hypothetical protein